MKDLLTTTKYNLSHMKTVQLTFGFVQDLLISSQKEKYCQIVTKAAKLSVNTY